MRELGSLGGGGEIADRAAVFARPEVSRRVPQAMWPFLVALAGVLWLLDIAARRLAPPRIGAMMTRVVTTGAPSARTERRRPAWVPPTPRNTSGSDEEQIEILEEAVAPPVQSDIPEDSYAGRLLAARRSARKKMDEDP